MNFSSKLGLGGHSFIEQLGNDPPAAFGEQCAIVSSCLDTGIQLIDTTYYQERIALGNVLKKLQRRHEAIIMAWNFFKEPGRENELVGFTQYEDHHLDAMLVELQTDSIDILIIHAHEDIEKLNQELALAKQWVESGKVKTVGLGMVERKQLEMLPDGHPITYVLAPYNAFNQGALDMFEMAREMGLRTIALSPFIRGWKLDEIGDDTAAVAEILLRWVTCQQLIDHVIVSMRKNEWINANLKAVNRGQLTEHEQTLLREWKVRFE